MPDSTVTPTGTGVPQVNEGTAAAGIRRNAVEKVGLDLTSTVIFYRYTVEGKQVLFIYRDGSSEGCIGMW